MDNPHANLPAIELTDEEIWHTIRYLDPDQRRNTSDLACVIAIAAAFDVWICLIFTAYKWLERSLALYGRYGR
jgi:hypothetical protein